MNRPFGCAGSSLSRQYVVTDGSGVKGKGLAPNIFLIKAVGVTIP